MKYRKKRIRLKYKKERVILSDVLPYEMPIIFSNRHFYKFLLKYGIEYQDNNIYWNNDKKKYTEDEKKILPTILELLFGCKKGSYDAVNYRIGLDCESWRMPFVYKINHKDNDFRELAVIHPKHQLEIVDLYDRYKELTLYYSSLSKYSIRKPDNIAKYVYYKDKLHRQVKGDRYDSIESYLNEYENLKTFFTYKKYTNIYRFYEDYRYQRAEKKYNHLTKFDISKCFDSIYTHSLVWATLGKGIVKDHLKTSAQTFAGEFDKFMQSINYGETNGILIGPEFSRIFAELIFQRIDKTVELKLIGQNIYLGKDYECYRYVDDYFLFFNDEKVRDKIMTTFRLELKEYKLGLSDAKTKHYDKPIITEITIAKMKIVELIDDNIKFKIEEAENDAHEEPQDDSDEIGIKDKFKIYVNPNKIAAKFKTILKESDVGYKDVLNYTLSTIARKLDVIIRKFDKKFRGYSENEVKGELVIGDEKKKYNLEKRFTSFIINILDFIFFIYTVHPKVNSTIKLSVILNSVISYYKGRYFFDRKGYKRFSMINKELVFKKIQDEIRLVLEKTKLLGHTQIETLFLLVMLKELGNDYMLPEMVVADYFCAQYVDNGGEKELECSEDLHTLSICMLLYYIGDKSSYSNLKLAISKYIIQKIEGTELSKRRIKTELILLLFDILSCPYMGNDFKKKMLTLYEISGLQEQDEIITISNKQKYWFTKWKDINLSKELNAKISLEVYS
jgi:Reverse transcriptase (RNA-dependent DNA polymerase).